MPLILVSSNAIVEDDSLTLSRVKTDYLSRMCEEILDYQMQICVDVAEIENFSSAFFFFSFSSF